MKNQFKSYFLLLSIFSFCWSPFYVFALPGPALPTDPEPPPIDTGGGMEVPLDDTFFLLFLLGAILAAFFAYKYYLDVLRKNSRHVGELPNDTQKL